MSNTADNNAATQAAAGEYLSFRLGAEEYGIPILTVQEIRVYSEATQIANAPRHIKGVVNLRGVIVPIVDLRILFDQDKVAYDEQTVTIVLNIAGKVVGVVVDGVSDVVALKTTDIKVPPAMGDALATNYVTGIATVTQADRERMLILMDIERLVSADELGVASNVSQ